MYKSERQRVLVAVEGALHFHQHVRDWVWGVRAVVMVEGALHRETAKVYMHY
jgi:hypothetical protein